jgi:hypothetical protein
MSQQISMEAAFPTFQKKCSELFDANMLLQAQVDVLSKELEAARAENEQLKASPAGSGLVGPDLAAQPPYPAGDEDETPSAQATRSAV